MTDIQRQKVLHFFNVLDRDGNGMLHESDFSLVAESLSDQVGHSEHSTSRLSLKVKAYSLFLQILEDIGQEDASIAPEVWLDFFEQYVLKESNNYIHKTSEYLFSLFDQNQDGYIDQTEYMDMFHAYGLFKANAARAFDLIDLNGDGQISKQELIKAFSEFFHSSDPEAAGNWIFGKWDVD